MDFERRTKESDWNHSIADEFCKEKLNCCISEMEDKEEKFVWISGRKFKFGIAVMIGNPEIPNTPTKDGWTPIHVASNHCKICLKFVYSIIFRAALTLPCFFKKWKLYNLLTLSYAYVWIKYIMNISRYLSHFMTNSTNCLSVSWKMMNMALNCIYV